MTHIEPKFDEIDRTILHLLQVDGALSQRQLAERVGLSQNACWRRVSRLKEAGILRGTAAVLDARAAGLDLTVFVMVRTRDHSRDWAQRFRQRAESIPEIIDLHRIGGDWDYMIKVVTTGMAGYDRLYQRLIDGLELETVTGLFAMEALLEGRPLEIPHR